MDESRAPVLGAVGVDIARDIRRMGLVQRLPLQDETDGVDGDGRCARKDREHDDPDEPSVGSTGRGAISTGPEHGAGPYRCCLSRASVAISVRSGFGVKSGGFKRSRTCSTILGRDWECPQRVRGTSNPTGTGTTASADLHASGRATASRPPWCRTRSRVERLRARNLGTFLERPDAGPEIVEPVRDGVRVRFEDAGRSLALFTGVRLADPKRLD